MRTDTSDVDLKDIVYLLVRKEDVPSISSEEAAQIGMITGRGIKENQIANLLYHGKSLMVERDCFLMDMRENDVAVVYAGIPFEEVER
tara:strand:- start:992 stop:1255 length:264 start_codon:yes stop_codon:yes gene_type:complete